MPGCNWQTLEREMAMVEELLEAEEECKSGIACGSSSDWCLRERGVQNGENTQRLQNVFSELCTVLWILIERAALRRHTEENKCSWYELEAAR